MTCAGANLDRLLEDSQKSKYSIRTVYLMQAILIKQSNVNYLEQLNVLQKPLKFTFGSGPDVVDHF